MLSNMPLSETIAWVIEKLWKYYIFNGNRISLTKRWFSQILMFTINHNNHEHSKYTIRNMSWKTVERHLCSCLPCIGNTVTVTGGANCTGGPQVDRTTQLTFSSPLASETQSLWQVVQTAQVDRTTQLTFSSPLASNQLNSTDIYFYDFPSTIYYLLFISLWNLKNCQTYWWLDVIIVRR